MSKVLIFCLIVALSFSCTVIKPNQVNIAENYATVLKGVSAVPENMYFRLYSLKAQSEQAQLSGLVSTTGAANEAIQYLDESFKNRIAFLNLVDSITEAYNIVRDYADLLLALVNESYLSRFISQKSSWQLSFEKLTSKYFLTAGKVSNSFTPVSVGASGLIGNILQEIGTTKIKSLQKKYLQQAIASSTPIVKVICQNFIDLDLPRLKADYVAMPSFLRENYKDFLGNINAYEKASGNNPYSYYRNYIPVYNYMQFQYYEAGLLLTRMEKCMKDLLLSFDAFLFCFDHDVSRSNLPEAISILNDSYSSLQLVISNFETIHNKYYKMF